MGDAWRLVAHSLSGRLLLLTILFVMITEVVIFYPSIGRYHRSLLESHIELAEIAILPFTEAGGEQLSAALRSELLARAGASAVMLKRPDQRELFLVTEMPPQINVTIDLRNHNFFTEVWRAVDCIINGGNRVLHVIAPTRIKGAETVEVIVGEGPIRDATDRLRARHSVAGAAPVDRHRRAGVLQSLFHCRAADAPYHPCDDILSPQSRRSGAHHLRLQAAR